MFTTLDKALVAFVMGGASIASLVFGVKINLDPTTVTAILTALTPVIIYFWPNKTVVK